MTDTTNFDAFSIRIAPLWLEHPLCQPFKFWRTKQVSRPVPFFCLRIEPMKGHQIPAINGVLKLGFPCRPQTRRWICWNRSPDACRSQYGRRPCWRPAKLCFEVLCSDSVFPYRHLGWSKIVCGIFPCQKHVPSSILSETTRSWGLHASLYVSLPAVLHCTC